MFFVAVVIGVNDDNNLVEWIIILIFFLTYLLSMRYSLFFNFLIINE